MSTIDERGHGGRWEERAKERLSPAAYDYYRGGAGEECTLRRNQEAWRQWSFRPRVLVDVRERSLRTTLLGQQVQSPIVVAPTAFHGLAHPRAELETVEGAGRGGHAFVNSSLSNTAVERVCAVATAPVWFQLYVMRDRAWTEAVVRRAEAAGCTALVLTVDAPVLGRRPRDVANSFHLPSHLRAENLVPAGFGDVPQDGPGSGLASWFQARLALDLRWEDLRWLRGLCSLPLVLKGIVHIEDARRAAEEGIDGVVVSNHGGRQLDGAVPTAFALPEIADAVGSRLEVHVDGGVRSGADVLRALALGAKGIWVGRPPLWGLAADGAAGVGAVLGALDDELDHCCTLAGVPDVRQVPRDLVVRETR